MLKFLKVLGLLILGLWAAGTLGVLAAMWIYRDIPAEVLEARYMTPASRFLNVDGARIHYRDEGEGAAVVLVHANFANLIGWDPLPWAWKTSALAAHLWVAPWLSTIPPGIRSALTD
jgi:hypothetical protein